MKSVAWVVLSAIAAGLVYALGPVASGAGISIGYALAASVAVLAGGCIMAWRAGSSPSLLNDGSTAAKSNTGADPKPAACDAQPTRKPNAASASAATAQAKPTAQPLVKQSPMQRDKSPHLQVKSESRTDGTVLLTVDAFGYNGGKYHDFILRDLRNAKLVPGVKWLDRDKQKKFRLRGVVAADKAQAAVEAINKIK